MNSRLSFPIEILRCPISGQTLKPAPESVVQSLLAAQRSGTLRNRNGEISEAFAGGLLTSDGRWFYPIRSGIPVLLAGEAVEPEAGDENRETRGTREDGTK